MTVEREHIPLGTQNILERYVGAFTQAERAIDSVAQHVNWTTCEPIFSGARRVGRVMGHEFPSTHSDWVTEDVSVISDISVPADTVTTTLQFIEHAIWAYQPVWNTFTEGTFVRFAGNIPREEIEMIALTMVEQSIQWHWIPTPPQPGRNLSKLVGAYLKHLPSEISRQIRPEISLQELREDFIPNPYVLTPEEIYIMKERITETLEELHMSPQQLWSFLETKEVSRHPMHREKTRYYFPVPLRHPREMWPLVAVLPPRERLAILYNLGYVYAGQTHAQVEKNIGLNPGHMRGLIYQARTFIEDAWHHDQGGREKFTPEEIRALIHEAVVDGGSVYRLHNGRTDRSAIRQRLRHLADTYGGELSARLNEHARKPGIRYQAVRLLIDGCTAEEVGVTLGISPKTVIDHARKTIKILS